MGNIDSTGGVYTELKVTNELLVKLTAHRKLHGITLKYILEFITDPNQTHQLLEQVVEMWNRSPYIKVEKKSWPWSNEKFQLWTQMFCKIVEDYQLALQISKWNLHFEICGDLYRPECFKLIDERLHSLGYRIEHSRNSKLKPLFTPLYMHFRYCRLDSHLLFEDYKRIIYQLG